MLDHLRVCIRPTGASLKDEQICRQKVRTKTLGIGGCRSCVFGTAKRVVEEAHRFQVEPKKQAHAFYIEGSVGKRQVGK
jgi:hypothetical protein